MGMEEGVIMKLHNPLNEKNVQYYLAKAAEQLRFLEADDWAEDIEQTAQSIQKEFDEARLNEELNTVR